jgi:hypothetical protein
MRLTSYLCALAIALAPIHARAADAITRWAWNNSTQNFSADRLTNGTGVGSIHHLLNSTERGSLWFFFNRTEFGSAYFFLNSTERGSRWYWFNQTGQGSRSYWQNQTGCLSRWYWENATNNPPARELCSSDTSYQVFLINMCLFGLLDIEPCTMTMNELQRRDPTGDRYMKRLRALRAR